MKHLLTPYFEPILGACLVFPFVAAIFTVPFLIRHYRKFGGIALMRVIVVYSFILYSMCAFLLTVLPLPSREAVAAMKPRPIGWIPFRDLYVGLVRAGFSLSAPETLVSGECWRRFFTSKDLFQVAANVVMQIPLGFYLRYYFRCSWKKTLAIGFGVSLFYELTQLSGLFFIYPKPYRYTEVDDLIANTLGAMIGYWITPLISLLLPGREEIDRISYQKGEHVTLIRRVFALLLDVMVFGGVEACCVLMAQRWPEAKLLDPIASAPILFIGYFVLLPYLLHGRTPGHALLRLRIVRESGGRPRPWQLLVRHLMIFVVEPFAAVIDLAAVMGIVLALTREDDAFLVQFILVFGFASVLAITLWYVFRCQRRHSAFPHGSLSCTRIVSEPRTPRE